MYSIGEIANLPLLICALDLYQNHTGVTATFLSREVTGGSQPYLLARLRSGTDCMLSTYVNLLVWLTENWPDNLEWPRNFLRPQPPAWEYLYAVTEASHIVPSKPDDNWRFGRSTDPWKSSLLVEDKEFCCVWVAKRRTYNKPEEGSVVSATPWIFNLHFAGRFDARNKEAFILAQGSAKT